MQVKSTMTTRLQIMRYLSTVKLVFNGHQRDLKKVSITGRCPFNTGSFHIKCKIGTWQSVLYTQVVL